MATTGSGLSTTTSYAKQLQAQYMKDQAAARAAAQRQAQNKLQGAQLGNASMPNTNTGTAFIDALKNAYNNVMPNKPMNMAPTFDASAQLGLPKMPTNTAQLGYANMDEARVENYYEKLYNAGAGKLVTDTLDGRGSIFSPGLDYYEPGNATQEEIDAAIAAGLDPDMIRGMSPANRYIEEHGIQGPGAPIRLPSGGGYTPPPSNTVIDTTGGTQYQDYYGGGGGGGYDYQTAQAVNQWYQGMLQWNINRPKGG